MEALLYMIRKNYSGLYLPMAGEKGLKSSITPNLGGDSKTDQNHFLLEPVSIENLHNNRNTRNFWCRGYIKKAQKHVILLCLEQIRSFWLLVCLWKFCRTGISEIY